MLAHCLTTLRLLLVLPTAIAFASPQAFSAWTSLVLMLIAIITDIADGKVARAQGTASAAGQLFDHTTDCLFVTSALTGAAYNGMLTPLLPPLVLIAFAQYVIYSYWLHRRKQLRMSMIGRWNGILYFVPPLLLASAALVPTGFQEVLNQLAYWFAWALLFSTLISIVDRTLARNAVKSQVQN
jgi:phosphatidylglycerophosphate synthase